MSDLYENIKNMRIELGMSQETLANLTGYTDRSSIAKIEKGNVDITLSKVEAFAKALRTTPAHLMGWDEPDIPQTIAAHFDGDEFTESELDEIYQFAEFVKKKKK